MFERFTSRARQVIGLAQMEARTHERVGTEHILLGLLREQEGLAARVLASFAITEEQVRAEVLQTLGPGEEPSGGGLRPIPFSPEAKMLLQHSLREALSLGHNYIGTEHLLLGLVREQDSAAARILLGQGVDREEIRNKVILMTSARSVHSSPSDDLDRSWLDFTPAEASDLALRLAPLASRITYEVRHHRGEDPTFRVTCQLVGDDGALRELVALEAVGIKVVIGRDHTVKFGHLEWPSESEGEG
ncbi:MAG: Clp protease N-terminal domain-containing protein [Solirubrobacteraceae bacterium]